MTPKQEAWAIQAEHVIKQMERRHFNAYYCSTKEEALTKALSIIEKGSVKWRLSYFRRSGSARLHKEPF